MMPSPTLSVWGVSRGGLCAANPGGALDFAQRDRRGSAGRFRLDLAGRTGLGGQQDCHPAALWCVVSLLERGGWLCVVSLWGRGMALRWCRWCGYRVSSDSAQKGVLSFLPMMVASHMIFSRGLHRTNSLPPGSVCFLVASLVPGVAVRVGAVGQSAGPPSRRAVDRQSPGCA